MPEPFYLYLRNHDCYGCPYELSQNLIEKQRLIGNERNDTFTLSTHHPWTIRIRNDSSQRYVSQFEEDE